MKFLVDRQTWHDREKGKNLRLIKTVIKDPLPGKTILSLLNETETVLDTECVHPETEFPWACGFWVPEEVIGGKLNLRIELPSGDCRIVSAGCMKAPPAALPLRLSKDLYSYMLKRERAGSTWPAVLRNFKVAGYLKKHDIIYEKPAGHWSEGLYIGNGIVGGIVTGDLKGRLSLGLDRADIRFATEDEHPLGPGYACDVHLGYKARGTFKQRLSLGAGTVTTGHGSFHVRTYIDKKTSAAIIEIRSNKAQNVSVIVTRRELPLLSDSMADMWNQSWARTATKEQLKQFQKDLRDSPRALISAQGTSLICRAPNMSVVNTLCANGKAEVRLFKNKVEAGFRLSAGKPLKIAVIVSTAVPGDEEQCIAGNEKLGQKALRIPYGAHKRSWEQFWQRSFVQMDDFLQENIFYQGIYHMACSFAGNHAPGFFGLTQPVDHRTWVDRHVTDAQTEMLTWGAYTGNHLELTSPLLHSYAECWKEHAEHSPHRGAKAPHNFVPVEGGGHAGLAVPMYDHPYPFGSTAWHVLDFWHDYLYSGDRGFLKDIAYPIMRSAGEAIIETMSYKNGKYHCLNSGSPEQNNASADNIYDRVCVEALFKALITASKVLNVDAKERRRIQSVLARLFPVPGDGKTIFETSGNHHPYRCHPVVLMGLYPLNLWREGVKEYDLAHDTFDVLTNLFAFHYEDRHATIFGHEGGIEPNGHATSFLLAFAARLKQPAAFNRLFNALVLGRQLKRNGLRSICDPRHSTLMERMGIIEASSGQSAAIAERLIQSYPDKVEVFPCVEKGRKMKFAGLRAMGGFVMSGEWTGSKVSFIAVTSLTGGTLNLSAPWDKSVPIWMKQGSRIRRFKSPIHLRKKETVILSQDRGQLKRHSWNIAVKPAKKPILIPVNVTDPHTTDVLYYPHDLPHGQDAVKGYLFLGNPIKAPKVLPHAWTEKDGLGHAAGSDYRLRQTAARVLGRYRDKKAVDALCGLALDKSTVVAATAVVSLVIHNRGTSDYALNRVLKKIRVKYVRNEARKALARRAREKWCN